MNMNHEPFFCVSVHVRQLLCMSSLDALRDASMYQCIPELRAHVILYMMIMPTQLVQVAIGNVSHHTRTVIYLATSVNIAVKERGDVRIDANEVALGAAILSNTCDFEDKIEYCVPVPQYFKTTDILKT
jgi:hypothetical protein